MRFFKKILVLTIFGIFLISVNVGCGRLNQIFFKKNKEWKHVEPQKASFIHTVKWPGETLQIIAKWYTGDSKNWNVLANANPVINPDRIFISNHIFIPNDLLKTRKSLPKEFIAEYYKKPEKKKKAKKAQLKSVPPSDKEDDFTLFGPK